MSGRILGDAVSMKGKRVGDEIQAQVMAALLAGQGVSEVAREFKLAKSTVSNWKKVLEAKIGQLEPKKVDDIEGLLIGYLKQNLTTLAVQSEFFRDRTWLQKQPASELAVLHGVIADKTFRIVGALESIQPKDQEQGAT